jgi:hypothetical protein
MDTLLLVALAVAVGIDLPLVLLLPALLSLLPGTGPLPQEWLGLASPGPAILGGVLYLAAWGATRAPGPRWMWEGLHALAAVPAAALLVYMFRPTDPWIPLVAFLALAALVAGYLQAGRLGARLLDRILPRRPRTPGPLLREAGEDLLVLALLLLLLFAPFVAGPVSVAGLAAFVAFGRPSLRAACFLPALIRGIFRHLTHPGGGWTPIEELPGWILAGEPRRPDSGRGTPGAARPRVDSRALGARAALAGSHELGIFRRGWLLRDGGRTRFVYRTVARSWEVELASATDTISSPDSPPWGNLVPVDPGRGSGVVLLPLDGPPDAGDHL